MKGAFVSRAMSAALIVAALATGACDDNPLDFEPGDTEQLRLNPSFMVIPSGRTATLDVTALNAGNEPNFAEVSQQASGCGGPASVTVADNPERTEAEPPGRFLVTAGNVLGEACIIVSAGGLTDTVEVVVVADAIVITSDHSAPVRAGGGGTVTAQLVAFDGTTAVTPFDAADATWASSNAAIVNIAADGTFTTSQSGTATITVTWSGTDDTGTSGLGVSRSATASITVVANVPASAEFDNNNDFGTLLVGGAPATAEVVVSDALGNQNTNQDELLGVTVMSSDPLVASATGEIVLTMDPESGEVTGAQVFVTVTGEGPGSAEISGTVQTTEGDFAFGPASVEVLLPGLTPSSGPPATDVVIAGAGFEATPPAFTVVTVDGETLGNFTVVSDNVINAQMPLFQLAGDYTVEIVVGGSLVTSFTWTQTVDFDEAATEENDFVLGGTPITAAIPILASGAFSAEPVDPVVFGAGNDYYAFTLSAATSINVLFDWVGGPDNDVFVTDAAFTAFQCGFAGATVNVPEQFSCSLAAGDYFLILDNFDLTDATYDISVTLP